MEALAAAPFDPVGVDKTANMLVSLITVLVAASPLSPLRQTATFHAQS